jgi:hypothetical protein
MAIYSQRAGSKNRVMADISIRMIDEKGVDIALCEYWNDSRMSYITLDKESALKFAAEIITKCTE